MGLAAGPVTQVIVCTPGSDTQLRAVGHGAVPRELVHHHSRRKDSMSMKGPAGSDAVKTVRLPRPWVR